MSHRWGIHVVMRVRVACAAVGAVGLALSAMPLRAAPIVQNSLITQNSPDYMYWEAEAFDRTTGPDNDTWRINFFPAGSPSGGKTIQSPVNQVTGDPGTNDLVTYRLQFTTPGDYYFYAFRTGGGDSIFPPPSFNADPTNVGTNNNRWNSLRVGWNELGPGDPAGAGGDDYPDASYFATGAYTYRVGAAEVNTPIELRLEGREANSEYDRVALHRSTGQTSAQLDGLSFSTTVINNPAPPPPPPPAVPVAGPFIAGPQGGNGFFGVREITGATGSPNYPELGNFQNDAVYNRLDKAAYTQANPSGNVVNYQAPVININDNDTQGNYGGDSLYRSDPDQANPNSDTVNNISLLATGTIRVPAAGTYTFGVRSDDGFRLTILDRQNGTVIPFSGTGGDANTQLNNGTLQAAVGRDDVDSFGTINLPAGDLPIQLLFFEGDGGSGVELFAAPGALTTFDASQFDLVGDVANGGLELVPEPGSAGLLGLAALGLIARRRRTG